MAYITLQGKDYNLGLAQKITNRDESMTIRLYWNKAIFSQLVYTDQQEYDDAKANLALITGGTGEGNVTVSGDLSVVGRFTSVGADGTTNFRAAWNVSKAPFQVDNIGLAMISIDTGVTGTGTIAYADFVHLGGGSFQTPPFLFSQLTDAANKQDDPFVITTKDTTGFSFDATPNRTVDILMVALESFTSS